MGVLARLYDFVAATPIDDGQVDAEFNQLVNLVSGAKTDTEVRFKLTGALPTLRVDNSGGGAVAKFDVSGVTKTEIDASGRLSSLVATGAAPFLVASQTRVDNLNAALLDGQAAASFHTKVNPFTVEGDATVNDAILELSRHNDVGADVQFANRQSFLEIVELAGAQDLVAIRKGSPYEASFLGQVRSLVSAPAAANDLTRKDYVDGRKTRWSFGAFYAGLPTTADEQPVFIVPNGVVSMRVTRIRGVYRSGTPSSSTVIRLHHLNSTGGSLATVDLTITSGQAANSVVSVVLGTPLTLADSDQLRLSVVSVGNHQNISVQVQGDQALGS